MGPRFKEEYQGDIKKLVKNDENLKALLINHTSIIESTLNIVKHDEEELEKQSHHFSVLTNQIQSLQDLVEAEQTLNDAILYLTQIVNEYERQQNAIIEVISDSHRDHVNHGLLTIKQIENQVEVIVKQVGTKYIVPGGVDLYSLSKIKPYLMGNQYVFKISVPLLRPQIFKLYRIVPVPIRSENYLLWIKTDHEMLIVSLDRQFFQFTNSKNIAECHEFGEQIVCYDPKLWFTADRIDCVWNVFNENSIEKCNFEKSLSENKFIELSNNRIIYVCKDKTKITIFCNNSISHDYLSGEGILESKDCSIKGANMHLDPPMDINERPIEIMIPKIDILNSKLKIETQQDAINETFHFVRSNFSEIDTKLNATKYELNNLSTWDNNYHDIHHYSLIYLMFTFIIIYLAIKFRQNFRWCTRSPTPAPRNNALSAGENVGNRQTL